MDTQTDLAVHRIRAYIARIRNAGKHSYAEAYFEALRWDGDEPDYHSYGISYMAAQAVRIQIDGLLS